MILGEDIIIGLADGEVEDGLEAEFEISDVVPKRRKRNSSEKKGGQGSIIHRQEEGERVMNGGIEGDMLIDPDNIDLTTVVQEKYEKKKKGKKKKGDRPVLMWEVLEQDNEIWIEENLKMDMDLINQNEMATETVEPSDDLIIPLLRYQKEWLAWSLKQEESAVRGGILADEMGMGKTLQAIALVLLKRKMLREISGYNLPASSPSSSKGLPPVKGTLVICPLIAVIQWVNEIERFTSKGSTKVLLYHGANRAKSLYQFSDYDFVITTYSIVEAEFRKYVMPPKEKCQYCGKLFYENKLRIHLKYMCGPGAARTDKQSKQHRKVTKSKKTPNLQKMNTVHDGGKNHDSGCKEMDNDGSFGNSGVAGPSSSAEKSILHSMTWERIILDEVSVLCLLLLCVLLMFY